MDKITTFVGEDLSGDSCIYVGRLDKNGDFTGDYLNVNDLQRIATAINEGKLWER